MSYDSGTLLRTRLLLALSVLVIAGAVWGVSQVQRSTADRAYREAAAGERMLAAMLDQETGLRGFALTRSEEFLGPFRAGLREFDVASAEVRDIADRDSEHMLIARQVRAAREWQGLAREEITVLRANRQRPLNPILAVERKRVFDRFRASNARFREQLDTLKRMVAHAGRTVSPLSAIVLDLDHFKQVNDRFGHGAGDDVLAAAGGVLESVTRTSDFAGRWGGEEFLVLLPDTDGHGALALAEKLRAAIAAIDLPEVDREITASFGVATYPADAGDGDGLVRMADRALYAAKRAGRNRVELAGTEPAEATKVTPGSPSRA